MARRTRRERLRAIFQGQIPDRPAVKVWGVGAKQDACIHPAFAPVRDLALERTDLMRHASAPFNLYCGQCSDRIETRTEPTPAPDWGHQNRTPQGRRVG